MQPGANRDLLVAEFQDIYAVTTGLPDTAPGTPVSLHNLPHLIICDGPTFNTHRCTFQAQRDQLAPLHLPLLLVTSHAENEPIPESVWEAVDDIVHPPIQRRVLRARVKSLLQLHQYSSALYHSERRYRTFVEQASDGVLIAGRTGPFVEVSDRSCEMTGYSRDELLSLTPEDLVTAESQAETPIRRGTLTNGQTHCDERVMQRKDGSTFLAEISVRLIDTSYVQATVRDVTERYEAQRALEESEQKYRLLAENASDVISLLDANLNHVYVSPAIEDLTGYTPEEIKTIPLEKLFTPGSWKAIRRAFWERMVAQQAGRDIAYTSSLELEYVHKLGHTVWAENLTKVLLDDNGRIANFVSVARDITERLEYEKELVHAKEEAEEMSRLKSAFLANMSHEIRTPLTAIIGFAEMLCDKIQGECLEFVELILSSGKRLNRTLTSILDLARLESRTMSMKREQVDLAAASREVVETFESVASDKGLQLRLDQTPTSIMAHTDPDAFKRILTHLVSNAIKFTNRGYVDVRLRGAAEHIVAEVEDTGMGIHDAAQHRIFEAFKQESEGIGRSHEGSGLGLAIVKQLVDLLDGTITVRSSKGEGSTFCVTLPATRVCDRNP